VKAQAVQLNWREVRYKTGELAGLNIYIEEEIMDFDDTGECPLCHVGCLDECESECLSRDLVFRRFVRVGNELKLALELMMRTLPSRDDRIRIEETIDEWKFMAGSL
jgi:hypothetical protein